jgi:hypothetical protein
MNKNIGHCLNGHRYGFFIDLKKGTMGQGYYPIGRIQCPGKEHDTWNFMDEKGKILTKKGYELAATITVSSGAFSP